jgi:hypothetical protein
MGYVGQGDDPKVDAAWELKMAVRKAQALERRGELAAAIKQFELVAQGAGEGHPHAAMAQERVRQLQARERVFALNQTRQQTGQVNDGLLRYKSPRITHTSMPRAPCASAASDSAGVFRLNAL